MDSNSALVVLDLLKQLAVSGRTVVSTIHQPSCEIYNSFDNLMLIVRGNVIYQASAAEAVQYFASIGSICPKLSNPADYFMKIMSENSLLLDRLEAEGKFLSDLSTMKTDTLEKDFVERVNKFVVEYNHSNQIPKLREDITDEDLSNNEIFNISWYLQTWYIIGRTYKDYFRNPLELRVKIIQVLFFAIFCITIYNDVTLKSFL